MCHACHVCQRGLRAHVPKCQRAKSVPIFYFHVPTYQNANKCANVPKACQFSNLAFQFFNYFSKGNIFQLLNFSKMVNTCKFQEYLGNSRKFISRKNLVSLFIVSYGHISHFVTIVDFKQANVCWVHIEKTNTQHLNLALQSYGFEKSMRNCCEGVCFRLWFWLQRCSSPSKWPAAHMSKDFNHSKAD